MFDKILAEGIVAHKRGIQSEYRPALNPNLLRIIHCIFRGSESGSGIPEPAARDLQGPDTDTAG